MSRYGEADEAALHRQWTTSSSDVLHGRSEYEGHGHAGIHACGHLDWTITNKGATWTATVTITIHDSNHGPVANARLSGSWSDGGAGSCTTSGSGQCAVSKSRIPKSTKSMTFTVVNVTQPTLTYNALNNRDPDGDSNGTVITLSRP